MKIIVAPDSFKGSLTAVQAAEAMAAGVKSVDSAIETMLLPAADGGEGTMSSLVGATNGELVSVHVQDPLGREIKACYGVLGDQKTCVIEIAEASGIMLLSTDELNPLLASSYGTGELLRHALNAGYRKFIIGLGGSATNDGGAGMLQALGMKLLDETGAELSKGCGSLSELYSIDRTNFHPAIAESSFVIACDVENPLVGPRGASAVFGPQKGATSEMITRLDANLTKWGNVIEQKSGISLHMQKGAGAAGGAGGAFLAFFPSVMKQGISVVLEAIAFEEQLEDTDLVVTGEGKTDVQTLSGKTPFGIAQVVQRSAKPVILISGVIEDDEQKLASFFTEIHSITDDRISAEDSIKNASHYLQLKTEEVIRGYLNQSHNYLLYK